MKLNVFEYDENGDLFVTGYTVESEEHEWGCCFPDRCLMPGEHMKSECHDAEMIEAQEKELTGPGDPNG